MPIDHVKLRTELQTDPAALGYAPLVAAGSDGAVADLLNRANRSGRRPVSVRDLLRWAAKTGVLADIVGASQSAVMPKGARAVALAALKLLERLDTLDLDDLDIRAMLDALVAAGVMTAVQRDDLLTLGNATVSRAEQLFGLGAIVDHLDVARALGRG